ncbi:phytochelatin synthase family protein [Lignipirellula cremea]|uniref:glutathione gamma-glutamylcysteinyltransferase n=1 Tax=Lignipirellula cremea TaxID=2528010 RepID=A0A518DLM6_9BACT|nr:phytochelatin synthase family protein [Lignipirellula cremea]QDU92732.1 Phytochelatin synthase [Lignipirellula cremea]
MHVFCRTVIGFAVGLFLARPAQAEPPVLPKYGERVVRLYQDRQHLQRRPAPDYWALSPYYVAQPNDVSCSAACVAMIVNALRARQSLPADAELATPESVVALVAAHRWGEKLSDDGPGVTLEELALILPDVFRATPGAAARTETLRFAGPTALADLRQVLLANERSDDDFLAANFLQSTATGDPAGAVGHLAPVAAYDVEQDRVLLLDPDRRWYEPYWIRVETLLAAISTVDPVAGRPRGLLRVTRLPAEPEASIAK